MKKVNPEFWSGRRVLVTGHTGFKGGWLVFWLRQMGALVYGYSKAPETNPNLFSALGVQEMCEKSYISDIRDQKSLEASIKESSPEIIIHMAAQPLVRRSYVDPVETYETNVLGTVYLLDAIRKAPNNVKAVVVVTTDKCYENKEWIWGYRENEPMGGSDPYSNSKGCAELVVDAFRKSFFNNVDEKKIAIASARAGNVIGGGDWSFDRLIPDAIRAISSNSTLQIRNPNAIRPWQHVLEPLSGYLLLAEGLINFRDQYVGGWNFGPSNEDSKSVESVLQIFSECWGEDAFWKYERGNHPHEATFLKLDSTKAFAELGWAPRWRLEKAIEKTVQWYKVFYESNASQKQIQEVMLSQLNHHQYV